jgi:hypothetical protein
VSAAGFIATTVRVVVILPPSPSCNSRACSVAEESNTAAAASVTDDSVSCTPLRLADGTATAIAVGGEPAAIAQLVVVIRWGKPGTFRLPTNKKKFCRLITLDILTKDRCRGSGFAVIRLSRLADPAMKLKKKFFLHFLPTAFNFYKSTY